MMRTEAQRDPCSLIRPLWTAIGWPLRTIRRWYENRAGTLFTGSASRSAPRELYAVVVRLPPPFNLPPL